LRPAPLSARELEDLVSKLLRQRAQPKVLVLPDFFIDRIVTYGAELRHFLSDVERVARQGGGSLGFKRQSLVRGGNAANMASALAALGARVWLVTKTSQLGLELLKLWMPEGVDLSLCRGDGEASMTVSIELEVEGRLCNVMISDPGSLASYGPEELGEGFHEALRKVGYVCVLNWASNRRGTDLAEYVLTQAKTLGSAKTFIDTGDPSQRASELEELVRRVFKPSLVDALGVNENEARWYASALGRGFKDPLLCAQEIHRELGLRVDLHTLTYSATFSREGEACVPCFKASPLRTTGAGDAWNAANVYAWDLGLEPRERLAFANAVAAMYISDPKGLHPSRERVIKFLEEEALKLQAEPAA